MLMLSTRCSLRVPLELMSRRLLTFFGSSLASLGPMFGNAVDSDWLFFQCWIAVVAISLQQMLLILCSCLDPMLFREAYPCLYVCTDGIEINDIETDMMRLINNICIAPIK